MYEEMRHRNIPLNGMTAVVIDRLGCSKNRQRTYKKIPLVVLTPSWVFAERHNGSKPNASTHLVSHLSPRVQTQNSHKLVTRNTNQNVYIYLTMSNKNSQEIVEETPELRSVKIGTLSSIPPLSRSFVRPTKQISLQLSHQSILEKQSPNQSFEWTVEEQLPSLPADYVLERTSVYVESSTSQEVANRISRSLRLESLAAKASAEENVSRKQNIIVGFETLLESI